MFRLISVGLPSGIPTCSCPGQAYLSEISVILSTNGRLVLPFGGQMHLRMMVGGIFQSDAHTLAAMHCDHAMVADTAVLCTTYLALYMTRGLC